MASRKDCARAGNDSSGTLADMKLVLADMRAEWIYLGPCACMHGPRIKSNCFKIVIFMASLAQLPALNEVLKDRAQSIPNNLAWPQPTAVNQHTA